MIKSEIKQYSGRTRKITGLPVAPGLIVHKSPDAENVFNVTHVESGLSVFSSVTDKQLPMVIKALSTEGHDWTVSAERIAGDNGYFYFVDSLMSALNKKKSLAQERRIAKDLEGRVQPASGARWGYRRDVVTPDFLIEAKTTSKQHLSVSVKDLAYLRTQACLLGKTPLFIVEFQTDLDVLVLPEEEYLGIFPGYSTEHTVHMMSDHVVLSPALIDLARKTTVRVMTKDGPYVLVDYQEFIEHLSEGN